MKNVFLLAGIFAFFTAVALFQAVDAARWRNQKQFWQSVGATTALAIITAGVLWIGIQNPHLNFLTNMGFSPDWECALTGTGGSEVCLRNPTPIPESKPSTASPRPNARGISN